MILGCYTLHLYCDCPTHKPLFHNLQMDLFEYVADGPDCYAKAREKAVKAGWKLTKERQTCPACNRDKETKTG